VPQLIKMQPVLKLSINHILLLISQWYLKRFRSYHIDKHTHPQTDTSENNTTISTLSLLFDSKYTKCMQLELQACQIRAPKCIRMQQFSTTKI